MAAGAGRRSAVLSIALHVACIVPALTAVVLGHGDLRDARDVALRSTALAEREPLIEPDELVVEPPTLARQDLEPPAHDVEMQTPLLDDLRIERPSVALDDPLRARGTNQRFAPRRTRPGADGAGGSGDGDEEGGTEEQGAVSPPPGPPPREPVHVAPVPIYEGYDADDYPERAVRRGWNGVAKLELTIDTRGLVGSVHVLEVSRECFRTAAEKIPKHWRYHPATLDGVRVTETIRRTLRFELGDR